MEVIIQPWLASKSDTDRGARFRGRGHGPWGEGASALLGQTRSRRPSASLASTSGRQWAPTVPDFHVALGPLTVTYRLSFTSPTSLSSAPLFLYALLFSLSFSPSASLFVSYPFLAILHWSPNATQALSLTGFRNPDYYYCLLLIRSRIDKK
jgi:hypothetical protein